MKRIWAFVAVAACWAVSLGIELGADGLPGRDLWAGAAAALAFTIAFRSPAIGLGAWGARVRERIEAQQVAAEIPAAAPAPVAAPERAARSRVEANTRRVARQRSVACVA